MKKDKLPKIPNLNKVLEAVGNSNEFESDDEIDSLIRDLEELSGEERAQLADLYEVIKFRKIQTVDEVCSLTKDPIKVVPGKRNGVICRHLRYELECNKLWYKGRYCPYIEVNKPIGDYDGD